jgi:hypothetical protein
MKKVLNIDIDVVGASASFLCAIHCAMVPLIVTFGMLSGVSFLANEVWDIVFIGVSVILAFSSLINGYRKHHQKWYPSITAILGFLSLILGHLIIGGMIGDILSVAGGLAIAAAHVLNYKACRTCKLCRN